MIKYTIAGRFQYLLNRTTSPAPPARAIIPATPTGSDRDPARYRNLFQPIPRFRHDAPVPCLPEDSWRTAVRVPVVRRYLLF